MAKGEKKEKQSKRKLMLIVLALVLVIGSAGGTYFFFGKDNQSHEPAEIPLEPFELGEMLVNLADPGARHYLSINPVLEYEKDSKLKEELKAKQFRLKDAVNTALRRKTSEDLMPAVSIQTVKEEILAAVNKELTTGQVQGVSFNVYLVQ